VVVGDIDADTEPPNYAGSVVVTFYGVRGSTPCAGEDTLGFGGNTSCVAIESPGADPIVCDLGTGLRYFGAQQPKDGSFRGIALVTHLHWDHIQGLPFFVPVLLPGAHLDLVGPDTPGGLRNAFDRFMADPFFPISLGDLAGEFVFHEASHKTFDLGGWTITVRPVPHTGQTNGYRIERGGVAIAYLPDHQMPVDGSMTVPVEALELCRDADLVIHDSQYTAEEFARKATWGHCTSAFALEVARQSGAKRLALFHHDPSHHDAWLAELIEETQRAGLSAGVDVLGASEGLSVALPG
jgi:phosphoribosyl 1,2-cyclic phosphodiesterase